MFKATLDSMVQTTFKTVEDTAEAVSTTVKETSVSALATAKRLTGQGVDPIVFDDKKVGSAVKAAHGFLHSTLLGGGFATTIADAELEKATQPA